MMEIKLKSVFLASAAALALGGPAVLAHAAITQDTAATAAPATAPALKPDNILLAEWTGLYDGVAPVV